MEPSMPSENSPEIALPIDRGQSALTFLQHYGITPQEPMIHSGDDTLINGGKEFLFLLKRLYGLVPAFSEGEALTRGGWFHTIAFHSFGVDPEIAASTLLPVVAARMKELDSICKQFKVSEEKKAGILERENKDYANALCWWEATRQVPIKQHGTFQEFFSKEEWITLGKELTLRFKSPEFKLTLIAILDILLYHKGLNSLWIADYKTTSDPCIIRLATCTVEFQTAHYLYILAWILQTGLLHKMFPDLPKDVKIGGMYHIAIQKPSIVFGQKDRPYYYLSEGRKKKMAGRIFPSSGGVWVGEIWPITIDENKQIIHQKNGDGVRSIDIDSESESVSWLHEQTGKKPEKEFSGDPDVALYTKRCLDWYLGKGEYSEDYEQRQAEPCVNFSRTDGRMLLDTAWYEEYITKLRRIEEACTRDPYPCNFLRSADQMRSYGGGLNPYAPFFLNDVAHWPDIIAKEHFIVKFRDDISEVQTAIIPAVI